MFLGLSFLGDTSFELTTLGRDHEDGAVSLGSTGDHVLDEVSVSRSINDGVVVLGSFELSEGDVDGDTSVSLRLELVKNPSEAERTLTYEFGFLLELLEGSLVNTTADVYEMTSGGGLSGVDVTDNNDVNMWFILGHL